MISNLDSPQNYSLKYGILILSTVSSLFLIWWTMVRQESVDWISGQVVHQPNTYAISQTEQGLTVVSNIFYNFQIVLPAGFKVQESRNPVYYYEDKNETICQIKNQILSYNSQTEADNFIEQDKSLTQAWAGQNQALKKEIDDEDSYIYQLLVPLDNNIIRYILTANPENKQTCLKFFERIKASFTEI